MKIVLVQNAPYFPAYGGANKANSFILEALATQGHECLAISVATGLMISKTLAAYASELRNKGISPALPDEQTICFHRRGVDVMAVESKHLHVKTREMVKARQPDWVLVSSEDPLYLLLRSTLDAGVGRVAYLAHTTALLPFGPGSFMRNSRGAELLKRADAVIAISRHVQEYLKNWGDIPAVKIGVPLFGSGPFSNLARHESGDILMINPCALKGISIFLDLADHFLEQSFAAVPTWGTSANELAALRARSNVRLLDPVEDIKDLLQRARILLVPSLWDEGFGMVVIEAMLRGIPVMAANVGGLHETKLGVDYLLPVNPIVEYSRELDSRLLPQAIVPSQAYEPWRMALHRLVTDRVHYEEISRRSFCAAAEYVAGLNIHSLEAILQSPPAARSKVGSVAVN